MGLLKNIQWKEVLNTIGEGILILLSMVIWLPITLYKFGLVAADNILKHYIKEDEGRK